MEVPIIGNYEGMKKEFKSVEKFNKYYSEHKDEMEQMSTQKLNKLFKVLDYKITKKDTRNKDGHLQNGSLCLKQVPETQGVIGNRKPNETESLTEIIDQLQKKLEIMENNFAKISDIVNQIVETLNPA